MKEISISNGICSFTKAPCPHVHAHDCRKCTDYQLYRRERLADIRRLAKDLKEIEAKDNFVVINSG